MSPVTTVAAPRALTELNSYSNGPAGSLINVLFGETKPSCFSQSSKSDSDLSKLGRAIFVPECLTISGHPVLFHQTKLNSSTRISMIPREKL